MLLYADEDFPLPAVVQLRQLGHDVITAQEDGNGSAADDALLQRAHALGRVMLTHNRRHFERLHGAGLPHSGILSCTHDADFGQLATRIDGVLNSMTAGRWCLRLNRPA